MPVLCLLFIASGICGFSLILKQTIDEADEHKKVSFIKLPEPVYSLLDRNGILRFFVEELTGRDLKILTDSEEFL